MKILNCIPRDVFPAVLIARLATATSIGGADRSGRSRSTMTWLPSAAKSTPPNCFTVPRTKMARQYPQVAPVQKSRLPRVFVTVAYNAFKTTPVFSGVGGPVQDAAAPGQTVSTGRRF